MDWNACNKNGLVKKVKIDGNLVTSLTKSSADKLKSEAMLQLNETTAGSKVTLAYDGLRELLEAIAIAEGYKIYNHECYCAFFKEVMDESDLARKFDSFRKIRNAVNYYGRNISPEEAEFLLKEMHLFIETIKTKFMTKHGRQ